MQSECFSLEKIPNINTHKFLDPELTIDELIELKKQNTVVVVEIDEDFELKGKIIRVAKLTEGLILIKAEVTVLENIDSDEQIVAITRKA